MSLNRFSVFVEVRKQQPTGFCACLNKYWLRIALPPENEASAFFCKKNMPTFLEEKWVPERCHRCCRFLFSKHQTRAYSKTVFFKKILEWLFCTENGAATFLGRHQVMRFSGKTELPSGAAFSIAKVPTHHHISTLGVDITIAAVSTVSKPRCSPWSCQMRAVGLPGVNDVQGSLNFETVVM